MQVFDYNEFTQNIPKVFSIALSDEVIINNKDGNRYKLLPVNEKNMPEKSPLEDIPRVKLNVTTEEIVEIFRECRAGI
ncbi:MAG: prevent-host-death protein [Treponema sp.]|jgi:hypothetical protein|nr:prevent-host-death protein [Treponema sp.]